MGLFRQQALIANAQRLKGDVVLLPLFSHGLLSLCLLVWLALLLLYLARSDLSRKETVRGFLEPTTGMMHLYSQSDGKLAQLLIEEGEQVSKGQGLAIINGDRVLADGQHLEQLLLAEYSAQRSTLQRQLERVDVLQDFKRQETENQISAVRENEQSLQRQRVTLLQNLDLAHRSVERFGALKDRGHVTEAESEQIRTRYLHARREVELLEARLSKHQQQQQQLATELHSLTALSEDRGDEIKLKLSGLAQEMARLRGRRAYIIKAPSDGTISDIQIKPGQMARRTQPLMSLLPSGTELIATLMVPVRAAGFLAPGQDVLFRYDAFPYQKFGLHAGRVETVAGSTLLPGEHTSHPFSIREPVYRVRARPLQDSVLAYGKSLTLKPGMTLQADIELEQRSLLEWLFEPLLSLRGKLQ